MEKEEECNCYYWCVDGSIGIMSMEYVSFQYDQKEEYYDYNYYFYNCDDNNHLRIRWSNNVIINEQKH